MFGLEIELNSYTELTFFLVVFFRAVLLGLGIAFAQYWQLDCLDWPFRFLTARETIWGMRNNFYSWDIDAIACFWASGWSKVCLCCVCRWNQVRERVLPYKEASLLWILAYWTVLVLFWRVSFPLYNPILNEQTIFKILMNSVMVIW